MKKILLVFCLIFCTVKLFGQQFSLYNTGTLYDSFDNPSQRSFIPDSSKKYAFNFFFPNFNTNIYLTGNGQATLKSRLFLGFYNDQDIKIGQNKHNHISANANFNWAMFKMFSSLNGDVEVGFSASTRAEGRGLASDESIALFNGPQLFKNNNYSNIFNNNFFNQLYNQFSFSYREKITKQFAFGVKVSVLMGIRYEKLSIKTSAITFDKPNDAADVNLSGYYMASYVPGNFDGRDFLPTFRNPGASISIGSSYRTEDGFLLQANIKDLGFIHWSKRSNIYQFDKSKTIEGLSSADREGNIYDAVNYIIHRNSTLGGFTTTINGRAEFSVNKNFWLDDDKSFKYSPTLIASKDLYFTGFTAALVNPVQYHNYTVTVTTTYDDLKIFNVGAQFMIKSPNAEFFIGSDMLMPSLKLLLASGSNVSYINKNNSLSGANFYIGFALKLGPIIEHPMNASSIPTGEKGFLGRLYNRWFKTNN